MKVVLHTEHCYEDLKSTVAHVDGYNGASHFSRLTAASTYSLSVHRE